MFSYKGISSDYEYKRGTVEASNEMEAVTKVKELYDIIVVISLSRMSNIKGVNVIRKGLNSQLETIENSLNKFTGRLANMSSSKDSNEVKGKKGKRSILSFGKKEGEPEDITERSPIMRGINKAISSVKGISMPGSSRSSQIVMDDEMHETLEEMFKKQANKGDKDDFLGDDLSSSLSSSKIQEVNKSVPKDNLGENSLDWSLLDSNSTEEVKKNKRIKVKEKEIVMFSKRLQIMLSSGVPLMSSLILLEKTSSESMGIVVSGIIDSIQSGSSFSEAIAKYPRQFDSMYVALVAVGEKSGGIERSLDDIIKSKEQQQKVSRKIKVVSIYPIIVGLLLSVMMILGSIFFLPMINDMYDVGEGAEMPIFTEVVISIMEKLPYIAVFAIAFIVIFTLLRRKIPEVNYMYRRYLDKFLLKMPVVRDVFNASYMYSFSSTVGLMLKNGIRLSDTLSLTGRTIDNIYIKSQIERMSDLMIHGLTFSESMAEQEHFDELLANIVLTGEESGQMVFALEQVSEYYETELLQRVDTLMEMVQPITILIVGAIVGVVLIAVYLPILDMSTGLGL